ncbi:MAG: ATP-binding protein [Saprospiraceae bacterium]|nr:ATP-binding protein [Saprospiraceae bacterium]
MTTLRSRYPGLRPFDADEKQHFFGRDEEIEAVCRLLDLDNLTILHSPSGMGKSSLINAGILPTLSEIRNWDIPYHIVAIRFTNYDPELARLRRERQGLTVLDAELIKDPIDRFIDACLGEDNQWEEVIPMPKPSLWLSAKKMLVDQAVHPLRIVFILDQFEELFTYPEERVEEFARQLGELYHQVTPEEVRKGIDRKQIIDGAQDGSGKPLPSPKVAQLMAKIEEPLDAKILISMRSDKLHYLERLKAYLPEMMLNSYELRSFDIDQAKKAIAQPASLDGERFISPEFSISEDILDEIIGFLQDKLTRRIDPSQLQIVCQHIEQRIIERERKIKKH